MAAARCLRHPWTIRQAAVLASQAFIQLLSYAEAIAGEAQSNERRG